MYNILNLSVTSAVLFALPLVVSVIWKKKFKSKVFLRYFFLGTVGFIVSARVLELAVHYFCIIQDNAVSRFINSNTAAFVIYGILMAGIFEEVGRYLIMKFFLKDNRTEINAITYGLGHGGIEVWIISLAATVTYLSVSIALRAGLPASDFDNTPGFETVLDTITNFTAFTGFLWVLERVVCMVLHVLFTLNVFYSVVYKKISLLFFAIASHAVVDTGAALYQRKVFTLVACEVWLLAGCAALAFATLYIRKRLAVTAQKQN